MKKHLLTLLMLLTLFGTINAQTAFEKEIDGIYYSLESFGAYDEEGNEHVYFWAVVIKTPKAYRGDIVIPESVTFENDVYPVTEIATEAFASSKIKSVVIPSSLGTIGYQAFDNCYELESVTFAPNTNNVYIQGYAFNNCMKLTYVTLPEKFRDLGNGLFRGCSSLESIVLPENLTNIPDETFSNCSSLKTPTIPKNLQSIGESAFCNCAITSIDAPNVTSIGANAFAGCEQLENVVLSNDLTQIPQNAFGNTTSLKSIELPSSLEYIDRMAFMASGLRSVTLPASVEIIKDEAFSQYAPTLNPSSG